MTKVSTAPVDIEDDLFTRGYDYIIGIDEAGRGAWFGELYVGAACLPIAVQRNRHDGMMAMLSDDLFFARLQKVFEGVRDSKMFKSTKAGTAHEKRVVQRNKVKRHLYAGFSASASSMAVDRLGINKATSELAWMAVQKVIGHLESEVVTAESELPPISYDWSNVFILCDAGITVSEIDKTKCGFIAIEKGDRNSLSIAMASLIAKTDRDTRFDVWHEAYPFYAFDSHKGYPNELHYKKVRELGLLPEHRRSWKSTDDMLAEGVAENSGG